MGKKHKNPRPGPQSPRIFTVAEAAAYLRLSPNTIRKLLHDGRLKGVRTGQYGGKWRISQRACDQFLMGDSGPTAA